MISETQSKANLQSLIKFIEDQKDNPNKQIIIDTVKSELQTWKDGKTVFNFTERRITDNTKEDVIEKLNQYTGDWFPEDVANYLF